MVCLGLLIVTACEDAPLGPSAAEGNEGVTLSWLMAARGAGADEPKAQAQMDFARRFQGDWTPAIELAMAEAEALLTVEAGGEQADSAAASEAVQTLASIHWTEWVESLTSCARRNLEADPSDGQTAGSGATPRTVEASAARGSRARRLLQGAFDARTEDDGRRAAQRAFYACELSRLR